MFKKFFFNILVLYKKKKDFLKSKNWRKYSKLILLSDKSKWVLDEITSELKSLCKILKIEILGERFLYNSNQQCVFFSNKYDIVRILPKTNHRVALSYFHGNPKVNREDKIIITILKKFIQKVKGIHVTNNKIKDILIKEGIPKKIIYKIPISIDIKKFNFFSLKKKIRLRKLFNISEKFVIGSFQKDGKGWGIGKKPKYIKGPDIFIKIVKLLDTKLKKKIHVILTGPARGYIINNLKKLNISFSHYSVKNYNEMQKYYALLDAYIVSSRDEGGPRAILESMATGTLIYSTKVGQANELIKQNYNGWLFDRKKLNHLCSLIINNIKNKKKTEKVLINARKTAVIYSYKNISNTWNKFFKNLLN